MRLDAKTAVEYTDKNGETKTRWRTIGSAWPLKNKKGYSIDLDAFPANGRLVLMEPYKDDDKQEYSGRKPQGYSGYDQGGPPPVDDGDIPW